MSVPSRHGFEFGPFRLEPAEGRLTRNGDPIRVPPKALELLAALVRQPGRLLTKEELLAEVWPGTFVEEGNLAVTMSTLRRALNDETGQTYIETVPKRGYRFVAAVREATVGARPSPAVADQAAVRARPWAWIVVAVAAAVGLFLAAWRLWPLSPAQDVHSLAVLPFRSLDPGDDQTHLERGMADALITRFGALQKPRVPPTAATRANEDPFEAGRRLGVDAVLTGSLQRSGDRLRVTAQLSRVADRGQIWAARFDEKFSDIFDLQDAIAERIASSVLRDVTSEDRATLRRRETTSVEAYELYLKGRERAGRRTMDSIQVAVQMYRAAIALDPKFALAYAGLADAYSTTASGLPPEIRYPLARAAAEQAVAINPRLTEAHVALAFVSYKAEWKWQLAEEELRRAVELDPNNSLAYLQFGELHKALGRWEQAIGDFRRVRAIDPYSLHARADEEALLLVVGRVPEARALIEEGLKQDPNSWEMHQGLSEVLDKEGRLDESIEEDLRAKLLSGTPAAEVDELRDAYRRGGEAGYLRKRNERLLARFASNAPALKGPASSLAYNYALLHDREQTLHWLEVATDRVEEAPFYLKYWFYDFVRDDPRFKALHQRVFGASPDGR